MRTELTLTTERIDECSLVKGRAMTEAMGAAVYFTGVVRGSEQGTKIAAIEYETFEKMAKHQFELIFKQAGERWSVESIRLAHRVGCVLVGEASVWVEVVTPHREEGFAACQFILAEMKRVVPIWKKPIA